MSTDAELLSAGRLGILLGLSFFFGLSFEGFYWSSARSRPGGIRTFPLISLSGALLYALEPRFASTFCIGLVVLGFWLYPYYRTEVSREEPSSETADGIMVPLCNVLAYVLGPVTLHQPWLAVAVTVVAVLLLRARDRLHALARKIPGREIITLAQFLVLAGVLLPLLPNRPVTALTPITPFQVGLAVVVVSSLSYGSYLLQKLLPAGGSLFLTSVLGGMYSSTATTVVLARQLRHGPPERHELRSGIVLATGMMYLRLGVVVAIFNPLLARALAWPLAALALSGVALAAVCLYGRRASRGDHVAALPPGNPLELSTASIFALLFVAISIISGWVKTRFGHVGIYSLAGIVGVTDIDPFVLSVAQGAVADLDRTVAAVAVLVAASSNNALKAVYAGLFAGWRRSAVVVASLAALSLLGLAAAAWLAHASRALATAG
jgi:uncharacterized membrane protein (DUF4010 family)